MNSRLATKRILVYEAIAFGIVIGFIWLDELFDLQHKVFGGAETPVNIYEAIAESAFVSLLALGTILLSNYYLSQIKQLEGTLPVCAVCKKIKEDDEWIPFEKYMDEHSAAEFTHGLCPVCAKPYFDELEEATMLVPDPRD